MCMISNQIYAREIYFITGWIVDEVLVVVGRPP